MKQNYFGFLSLLALCHSGFAAAQEKANATPNVILFLTDDQGWGDFGFNGNDKIHTPNLDSLYSVSSRFTNFYVSPLSATTRAGLLTGRDHLRTGALCVTRAAENMDSGEKTIAEMFREKGYVTGCFGKWHNGAHYPQDPNGQGFEEFFGFCSGHFPNYFDRPLQHNQSFENTKGYITDVLTDAAINFIKEHKSGAPFFCYIPYNAPHAPYQVPDKYYDKYAYLHKDPSDPTAAVYAMCENLDDNIGKVLSAVKDMNIDDNTLIVFLTDNGPNNWRYNGGMRGKKGDIYEGGIKVPCMMYWKGKLLSKDIDANTSYIDILPTIMDLCGIKNYPLKSRPIDGLSLKPMLCPDDKLDEKRLETELNKRYLYTHRSTSDYQLDLNDGLIFNKEYKWMIHQNNAIELYDKLKDKEEKNNIASKEPKQAELMEALYNMWFDGVAKEYVKHNVRTAKIGLLKSDVVLPSHEAYISGKVKYNKNKYGWAGDWITNIYVGDTINWDIDVVKSGEYTVELEYSLSNQAPDFELALQTKGCYASTPFVKLECFKPREIDSPDRVTRVEAYEQSWNSTPIGVLKLKKGLTQISVKINSLIPYIKGLDIKGITIKCRNE